MDGQDLAAPGRLPAEWRWRHTSFKWGVGRVWRRRKCWIRARVQRNVAQQRVCFHEDSECLIFSSSEASHIGSSWRTLRIVTDISPHRHIHFINNSHQLYFQSMYWIRILPAACTSTAQSGPCAELLSAAPCRGPSPSRSGPPTPGQTSGRARSVSRGLWSWEKLHFREANNKNGNSNQPRASPHPRVVPLWPGDRGKGEALPASLCQPSPSASHPLLEAGHVHPAKICPSPRKGRTGKRAKVLRLV